ncbi:MAG: hypothetical protein WCP14_02540 [bacterium]
MGIAQSVSRTRAKIKSLFYKRGYVYAGAATVLLAPSLSYAARFSLNPLDWIVDFFTAMFTSIAQAIYGFGFVLLSLAMFMSKMVITVGTDPTNTMYQQLVVSTDTIAYSIFGVTLLVAIFATTFNVGLKEWTLSAMVPKLALTIFMMIISRPLAAVIYDLASVMVNQIIGTQSMTEVLMATYSGIGTGSNVVVAFLSIFVAIIALLIMICACAMLAFRAVVVMLCIILAPLAFACNVLPWTKSVYSTWWKEFTKWVFFLPIFVLVLFVGQLITFGASKTSLVGTAKTLVSQKGKQFIQDEIVTGGKYPWATDNSKSFGMGGGIDVMAGGAPKSIIEIFDPVSYYLLFAGLVATIAAIFLPLKFLGGAAAAIGKAGQGMVTNKAKSLGGMVMKEGSKAMNKSGIPWNERVHSGLGGEAAANSDNFGKRILGKASAIVLGVNDGDAEKRQAGDEELVTKEASFDPMGRERLRVLTDKDGDYKFKGDQAFAHMGKETEAGYEYDRHGVITDVPIKDEYYKDFKTKDMQELFIKEENSHHGGPVLTDEERSKVSRWTAKNGRLQRKASDMGDSRVTSAVIRANGKDYKDLLAGNMGKNFAAEKRRAEKLRASNPGDLQTGAEADNIIFDASKTFTDNTGKINPEHMALVDFSQVTDFSQFSQEQTETINTRVAAASTHMDRSGKVTADSKKVLGAFEKSAKREKSKSAAQTEAMIEEVSKAQEEAEPINRAQIDAAKAATAAAAAHAAAAATATEKAAAAKQAKFEEAEKRATIDETRAAGPAHATVEEQDKATAINKQIDDL